MSDPVVKDHRPAPTRPDLEISALEVDEISVDLAEIGFLPERIEDDSWSFRGEYASGYTHRFHTYPAMMLPQVARRLIGRFAADGQTVLDPFCGSGSVLVEANVAGCNVWGFDINPLAILMARVKSRPLSPERLNSWLNWVSARAEAAAKEEIPAFFNLDYWFKPNVARALSRLRSTIAEIDDEAAREFFAVVFSEVVRLSSNSRAREFKLYRYSPENLLAHNPDPMKMFGERALRNIEGMQDFQAAARRDRFVRPTIRDVVLPSPADSVGPPPGSIDLVLTSPPYGDSRTTVAYGQFSRLSLQFLGPLCGYDFEATGESPQDLDRRMLGGARSAGGKLCLPSSVLERAIEQVAAKDNARAREVEAFYADFSVCLRNIAALVAPAGRMCFVVGNRRVKGVQLDTDYIIAEMAAGLGFVVEEVIVRSIPAKRMPLRNSPSNRPGQTENTMHREYIVVLRKDD